jgi:uncharacterized pyridoxamine 5'-phosphate oxidase family protein
MKKETMKFFSEANTYFLFTVNALGMPVARSIKNIVPINEKLYFIMDTTVLPHKELQENDNVAICAYTKNKMLRLDGKAAFDDSKKTRGAISEEDSEFATTSSTVRTAPFCLESVTETLRDYKYKN